MYHHRVRYKSRFKPTQRCRVESHCFFEWLKTDDPTVVGRPAHKLQPHRLRAFKRSRDPSFAD